MKEICFYCFCTLSISSQKVCYTGAVDDKGRVKEDKESKPNGGGLSKPRRSSLSREGTAKDELLFFLVVLVKEKGCMRQQPLCVLYDCRFCFLTNTYISKGQR